MAMLAPRLFRYSPGSHPSSSVAPVKGQRTGTDPERSEPFEHFQAERIGTVERLQGRLSRMRRPRKRGKTLADRETRTARGPGAQHPLSLEKALAELRRQVRALDAQSENQAAGKASIHAVVDQTYVNDKINTPQADVVRLTADLQQVNGVWKISNVTVLEHARQPRERFGLGRLQRPRGSSGLLAAADATGSRRSEAVVAWCRAACGSVVESRGQSQAKRPT